MNDIQTIFKNIGLEKERNPFSKSYNQYFIYTEEDNMIWHGYLNLKKDSEKLYQVSNKIGKIMYIFGEKPCQSNLSQTTKDFKDKAIGKVHPQLKLFNDTN